MSHELGPKMSSGVATGGTFHRNGGGCGGVRVSASRIQAGDRVVIP